MAAPQLRRDLGLSAATAVVVGTMIGVGIFLGPRVIAQTLTTPGLMLLVWVVGGLFCFCGALTYAELGAMMPESGGSYAYIRRAYGPFWAYLSGWSGFAVGKAASVSALAVGFAEFSPPLLAAMGMIPDGATFTRAGQVGIALVLIVAITLVNVLGVRHAGRLGVVAMVLKVGALALLIGGGLLVLSGGFGALAAAPLLPASGAGLSLISAFGLALIPVFFAYDGWVNSTQVAEEVRDPERNLPRSLILGTLIVMVVYALANLVYLLALGPANVGASSFAAGDTGTAIAGPIAGTLVTLAILISIVGTINAVTLSGPRIGYAMARDGLFFRKVNEVTRFGTPGWSIVLQGAIAAALVLIPPIGGKPLFDTLLTYIVVDAFLFYALGASAVIVFRRTMPHARRPYKVPWYPVIPLIFIVGTGLFLLNTFIASPLEALGGILIVAVGAPFYAYWRARSGPGRLRNVTYEVRGASASATDDGDARTSEREANDATAPEHAKA